MPREPSEPPAPSPRQQHEDILRSLEALGKETDIPEALAGIRELKTMLEAPEMKQALTSLEKRPLLALKPTFHAHLLPTGLLYVAIGASALAASVTGIYAAIDSTPLPWSFGIALLASAGFLLLAMYRRFSVIFDQTELRCVARGNSFSRLRTGSMRFSDIRHVTERRHEKILEVSGEAGATLEIPMQVQEYSRLLSVLSGLAARHHGRRPAAPVSHA